MKRLIIDMNHLFHRAFFVRQDNILEEGFGLLRHVCLQSILSNLKKHSPDEVIIACEGRGNWRREFYEDYKAHRGKKKEKDDIPWSEVYEFLNNFLKELDDHFPFILLSVEEAEADDIIGALADYFDDGQTVILSSDKDFTQLLRNDNVEIVDPLKGKKVEADDPEKELQKLILQGDKADNIPHCENRLGPKTAEKLVNDPEKLKEKLQDEDFREQYKLNRMLIDLRRMPDVIRETIIEKYQNSTPLNMVGEDLLNYFAENDLYELMRNLDDWVQPIRKIENSYG